MDTHQNQLRQRPKQRQRLSMPSQLILLAHLILKPIWIKTKQVSQTDRHSCNGYTQKTKPIISITLQSKWVYSPTKNSYVVFSRELLTQYRWRFCTYTHQKIACLRCCWIKISITLSDRVKYVFWQWFLMAKITKPYSIRDWVGYLKKSHTHIVIKISLLQKVTGI